MMCVVSGTVCLGRARLLGNSWAELLVQWGQIHVVVASKRDESESQRHSGSDHMEPW